MQKNNKAVKNQLILKTNFKMAKIYNKITVLMPIILKLYKNNLIQKKKTKILKKLVFFYFLKFILIIKYKLKSNK